MPRAKRRPDGTYEYKGTVGRDLYGNAIRKSFYSTKSKADAKKKCEQYRLEHELIRQTGVTSTQDKSFSHWAISYLEEYKRPTVARSSYVSTYKPEIDRMIAYFGDAALTSIRPLDVQRYFNSLQHLSMSRLKKQKFILNAVFESAIDNDLIYKNPAKHCTISTTQQPRARRALTDQQIQSFSAAAFGVRDDALLMLLTGLRRGEMLGLMWKDYDSTKKTLSVERSLSEVDNHIEIRPPKWNSYRVVPLSDAACALLDRIPHTSPYVFPNRRGEPQLPNTWAQIYKRFSNSLPEELQVTSHELRHTYGTQLMRNGVDIYTIQKLLGHKSVEITANIYVHSDPDSLRSAVNRTTTFTTTKKSI